MTLNEALAAHRLETARRLGLALVAVPATRTPAAVLGLHDALAALSDFREAAGLLETHAELLAPEGFAVALRLAEDAHQLAGEHHYRLSDEAAQGLTFDQYLDRYRTLASRRFADALAQADTEERRQSLRVALQRCQRPLPPGLAPASAPSLPSEPTATGLLTGRITHADGAPAADVVVTLGLATRVAFADPATYTSPDSDYFPEIGPLQKLTARTDSDGAFAFPEVPVGRHDFIAVTLDPAVNAISTRFLARDIDIAANRATDAGSLVVSEWQSAPALPAPSPHPDTRRLDGDTWRKLADTRLHNPFHYDFHRQLLRLPLPAAFDPARETLRVEITPGQPVPAQIIDGEVALMVGLPPRADRHVALYAGPKNASAQDNAPSALRLVEESPSIWMLDTGVAQFRIPGPAASADTPPILAVRGADRRWRGSGRFVLPADVSVLRRTTELLHQGPVLVEVHVTYTLSTGATYSLRLEAHAGEPFLAARETSSPLEGAAFEFSLAEFSGGRAYLHWVREHPYGARHWWTLEKKDAQIARLPESVPWWIPPQGFGLALTPDGLDQQDYIGVFTRRRGEWIDRAFERIAQGPVDMDGSENRELDWPYPEMVGSSISMITAHTGADGDAFIRFGLFDGERQWSLYASALSANDGPHKEISALQHANSSPRLQEFKDWHFDVPDARARPHVVAARDQLVALRAKTRHPRFAPLWEKITKKKIPGPAKGLAFALDGDPLIAWRKRIELLGVAGVRSRMTLLGRDWSDMYSPVYGRPITAWAEDYDLVAASGVFTPEEEREVRAFFILMGHMYAEPDFMNWRFNSRNANFEADRTDIVGAVGLVFDGHPDSGKFLDHVIELTKKSLRVYCTPGSGKWYENPACYYLHASKCRMNLVFHLANHGRIRLDDIPRLREFLLWGVVLLMPPSPVSYARMRDGGGAGAYARAEKIRKVPPVGDHASIGRWLPEHYATIGKLFQKTDPAFGQRLLDAYFAASADGLRLVHPGGAPVEQEGEQTFHDAYAGSAGGNLPLFFAVIDDADIPRAVPPLPLASRRLEGFGAVFRHATDTDREGYVLLKQGPGGYRYQRTEGSFIFFADGHPLVLDGGEAGETWRHSTLSFHDVHMPLAPGHVERIFTSPEFHFTQGVHPDAIAPGQPVFLNDNCHHELVPEAYRRFRQEPPGVVRSLAWIDGRTLIVHDAVNIDAAIPSHWHLQVVGSAPVGDAVAGYRFPGRFGTDLQVLFPGQTFAAASVEHLPIHEYTGTPAEWFAQQHLQVAAPSARHYLAVLQPLDEGEIPVEAEAIHQNGRIIGAVVNSPGRTDHIWFAREAIAATGDDHAFNGASGAILRRADHTSLAVIGPGCVRHDALELTSSGPSALLRVTGGKLRLTAQGEGTVVLRHGDRHRTFSVTGSLELDLPA